MYNETRGRYEYYDGLVIISDELRDQLVWEILGRMCHLLGDLSVPAHAHRDEHGVPPTDSYEDWVGGSGDPYAYWNHTNVGPMVNPYVSSNPLHYLMYTTQQIADHFGSNGPYEGDGNDIIGGNPLPEEIAFLNSLPLSSLGSPTGMAGPFDVPNLTNIRNKTLPYVIRATAGLLYWFAMETDLLANTLVQNTFGGGTIRVNGANRSSGFRIPAWGSQPSVTLEAVDQPFGGCNRAFVRWRKLVNGNEVQSWTARTITITPEANTTYEAVFSIPPSTFSLNQPPSSSDVYLGETVDFTSIVSPANPSATYSWTWQARYLIGNTFQWIRADQDPGPNVQGAGFSYLSSTASLTNDHFTPYYNGAGGRDSVIRIVGRIVSCDAIGELSRYLTLRTTPRPPDPPPPPPPDYGCPFVYTWNGSAWVEDNNVLLTSEFNERCH